MERGRLGQSEAASGGREERTWKELSEIFENGLVYIPRRHIMFHKFVVPFRIHKFGEKGHSCVREYNYNLFLASQWEKIMAFHDFP
jgi:hypothetical protein